MPDPNGSAVVYRGERYIPIAQAAARIGVVRQTLYRWCLEKKKVNGKPLPAVRHNVSGQLYVHEGSIPDREDLLSPV